MSGLVGNRFFIKNEFKKRDEQFTKYDTNTLGLLGIFVLIFEGKAFELSKAFFGGIASMIDANALEGW